MANSGQAAEALQYYHRALELNPAYIRARYVCLEYISMSRSDFIHQIQLGNLVYQSSSKPKTSILPSHTDRHNFKQFEEAVHHISTALLLQNSDGVQDPEGLNEKRGVVSAALWDTLKTACLHMQRIDLATLCDQRNLDGELDL